MIQVQIRAYPAQGFDTFGCAGRRWGKSPVVVTVKDDAALPSEITPTQLATLQASTMIAVVPVGDATSADLDIAAVRAELSKRTAELTEARAQLATAIESMEDSARQMTSREEASGAKVAALESEIAILKSRSNPSRK